MTPEQRADDIVMHWSGRLAEPLSPIDAIALRSLIAQQIAQAITESQSGQQDRAA